MDKSFLKEYSTFYSVMVVWNIVKYKQYYSFINKIQSGKVIKLFMIIRKILENLKKILENTSFTRKSWRTPDYCYIRQNTWFLYSRHTECTTLLKYSIFHTVKPLITNTSEEFIKCRLNNFSMSCILYYVNFRICKNKKKAMNMLEQF